MVVELLRWARSEVLLAGWRAGLWTPPDRRVLDGLILPWLARAPGYERVLFVGVKEYNAPNRALFAGRAYATLEPEPRFAPFGAERHFVARLEELDELVAPSSFDAIVINGVLGHGLDAPADVERALAACHRALRDGGFLVLGVNEEIPSAVDLTGVPAMRAFAPAQFPPLGATRHVLQTPLRERSHTFLFYART